MRRLLNIMEVKDSLDKVKNSLGNFVEEKLSRYKIFIDLLGLYYIDLEKFNNEFFFIINDLKKITVPLDLKILYLLFLNDLERCRKK